METTVHDQTLVKHREAVGVFQTPEALQETIDELETSGFSRHEISVLEEGDEMSERFGHETLPPEMLSENAFAPRNAQVAREDLGVVQGTIISAGIFFGVILAISASALLPFNGVLTVLIGAAIGAAIGAGIAYGFTRKYYIKVRKQIRKGGLLLWVNTPNKDKETQACKILRKHHAMNIHVHDVPA